MIVMSLHVTETYASKVQSHVTNDAQLVSYFNPFVTGGTLKYRILFSIIEIKAIQ